MQRDEFIQLKIVSLLEPMACIACSRFNSIATVEMPDGSRQRMLHCKRLDCDNWQTEEKTAHPISITDTS